MGQICCKICRKKLYPEGEYWYSYSKRHGVPMFACRPRGVSPFWDGHEPCDMEMLARELVEVIKG